MKIYDETLQQYVEVSIKALDSMPIGSIIMFAGETIPTGWLICDGDTLNEEEYPELYDVIGYTYGGSGLDFNLPNFKGKVPVGLDSTQTEFDTLGETGGSKELQAHSHTLEIRNCTQVRGGDALDAPYYTPGTNWYGTNYWATSTAGTGNSGNLQPYIVVNYIIKATNTTPTMASVVNATNNSTTDTYSCDYSNKHYGGVVLYDNSTGTTGDITLSDSVANYNYLEIEYVRSGYTKSTGKIKVASEVLLDGYWYYYDSGLGKVIFQNYCEIPSISGTTITRRNTYYTNVVGDGGGTYTGDFTGGIAITRVVGYK